MVAETAAGTGMCVIPVGGGTKLHLGNRPAAPAIAIRTSRLRGIVEYEPDNMSVSVLAGTPLAEVQALLATHRQFIPIDPPNPERATIGGLISCNASGPLRCRYGTIRDILLGVKLVHADGICTKAGGKLVKNVTGYDMCKLYTGALGTLGILTEATFKLMPLPDAVATIVLGFDSIHDAMEMAHALLREDLLPEALEVWNAAALARTGAGPVRTPWVLMLRIGDVPPALEWQAGRAVDIAAAKSAPVLMRLETADSGEFWRRAAQAREQEIPEPDALVKCPVLHRSMAETAHHMQDMARSLKAEIEIYTHAATFVLYGRLIWHEGIPGADLLRARLTELRSYCAALGGHMVAEKIQPEVKSGFDVWGYDAPALEIMRRVKRQFDPKGILNSGRFVGGI